MKNKIREIREEQGITQVELAHKAGLSMGYLSHLENGSRDNPSYQAMVKIAKALNVPIDSFAVDFEDDNSNIFLSTIKTDVENMSKKQLNMLRDSIETIKKYDF